MTGRTVESGSHQFEVGTRKWWIIVTAIQYVGSEEAAANAAEAVNIALLDGHVPPDEIFKMDEEDSP